MSIFGKLMDSMRLTDDDYDIDDEDFIDDEEDFEPAPRKPLISRAAKADDDFVDLDEEEPAKPRFPFAKSSAPAKVVSFNRGPEITLVKPTSMEDSREICDNLIAGKTILLNMEGIHMEIAQRIIDFTCGATYALDGKLQKISNYIFIATPSSVSLSGEFPELLADGSINFSGNNFHFN